MDQDFLKGPDTRTKGILVLCPYPGMAKAGASGLKMSKLGLFQTDTSAGAVDICPWEDVSEVSCFLSPDSV